MCTECWSTVKDTYAFKKRCFDNEEKLRNFSKKSNNGLNSLSVEEVLTAINRREKVSDSHFDNDLPDFKNKDEYSDSECSEDIFDEEVNDDVVEIRIKNRKHVDDTKLNNINLKNYDSIIDVGKSENHRILAEVTELVREELVKQEISVEEHDIGHNGFAAFKEESKSSIWETLGETSLVTPSNYLNVEAETSKQHTSSHASNPLTGMDKSLTIHLIDCIKYQSNLNIRNISTETENISHPHPELKSNNNSLKRTIKCGDCEFVTSSKDTMTRHMEKHILYSDTGNKCPNCQKVYRNPDILEEHIQSCKSSLREKESPKTLSNKTRQIFIHHNILLNTNKERCENIEKAPNKATGCEQEITQESTPHSNLKATSIKTFKKVVYQCNNHNCSYKTTFYSKHVFHLQNVHNRGFICDICQNGYKSSDYLKAHRLTHFKNGKFVCDVCPKKFNRIGFLNKHKMIHWDRNYSCNICKKAFKTKDCLRRHRFIHSEERKFVCDVCKKGFKCSRTLGRHKSTHRSDRRFICDICDKAFKTNPVMKNHRLTHCDEWEFVCDVCQKRFRTKRVLNSHRAVHRDSANLACHICQKILKSRNTLKQHQKVHSDVVNFFCHICQKGFKHRASLANHKQTHHTEKSFVCYTCQKSFKTKYLITMHQAIHSADRNYICNTCKKSYKRNGDLYVHQLKHCKGRRFLCDVCQKGFKAKELLRKHQKTHCSR